MMNWRVVISLYTCCLKMIVGNLNAKVGRENMYRPIIGPDPCTKQAMTMVRD